ncbi:MAG: biopolymer transporter ExbD [Planctomycetaceae bacterium]|nr:biopolymer transporter ExbD [Planctomycetaceae bacterium]
MPLKTEQIEEPGLNLTPMLDIVLLLVIFFMVGTQFTRHETQYEIQLPQVSEAKPLTILPDEIVLNVTADGRIFLGGSEVTEQEVENQLILAREQYPNQAVVIRGDGDGRYQHVMTLLNLCKRARIANIQLANQLEGEAGA